MHGERKYQIRTMFWCHVAHGSTSCKRRRNVDDYGNNVIFTAKLWDFKTEEDRLKKKKKDKKKRVLLWRFENNLSEKNKTKSKDSFPWALDQSNACASHASPPNVQSSLWRWGWLHTLGLWQEGRYKAQNGLESYATRFEVLSMEWV